MSTMRMKLRFVSASQFLQQFRLDVRHKPSKEHIIPNALSQLASTNVGCSDPSHSELDVLFTYNTTLIEIHPTLVSRILAGYNADPWRVRLRLQIQRNSNLGTDATALPFVLGFVSPKDADSYMEPRPEGGDLLATNALCIQHGPAIDGLPTPDRSKLLYYINKLIDVYQLFIPPSVAPDILAIVNGEGYLGFSRCYKIIACSWFIRGLTKLLQSFIQHCSQCLALQTKRHPPSGLLQPIESPPVTFFTLTLDFVLALPLTKEKFNALMSVTCKFSKRVTLIPGADTWSAEDWPHAFLKRLDLIDWGLSGELITDRDPKFLSSFWKALFIKLGVKLLYSTAYHLQTDGTSERTNQTVKIVLRFFVYAIDNPSRWSEVLPRIQFLLNNTSSSTTGKTPNEVAYRFSPMKLLDLCLATTLPDAYVARTAAADAILFALANQKEHYNRSHQPLFMKAGDRAMLKLHKGYSIPSSVGVTKKLTQQYVGPFRIIEKIGCLAYKLEVPGDWRIYPVFSIAQLEPALAPSKNLFHRPRPQQPPFVFVEGDTDSHKSFELDRFLNKRIVKNGKGLAIEYLVRCTGYGPEWHRCYNVKNLNNTVNLVRAYEEGLTQRGHWGFFL